MKFEINCAITATFFMLNVGFVTKTDDILTVFVTSVVMGAMVFFTALTKRDQ